MPHSRLTSARAIVDSAQALYADDPAALRTLTRLATRIDEPLRVAIVGSVKAGKSTLLNGLLGERIAPTDARECTRIVTWYHYGNAPSVRGTLTTGTVQTVPARRQSSRLELDLGGLTAEDFERIDVTWPAPGVRDITLIDTPGTESLSHDVANQTAEFLAHEDGVAGADAVIYLLRSLHESDVRYLQEINARTRYGTARMGTIAVLSRADEVGSSRLTAMISINDVVDRLRKHPDLASMCDAIVPVSGLMGMGAASLRQADFVVFRDLADRDPKTTEHLLLSAEHFIASKESWLPNEQTRIDLVDRFGMYGIRIAFAAIRGGIADAESLATELTRRSGLEELRRLIDVNFSQRQSELKAHAVVLAVNELLRRTPKPGSAELLARTDEHLTNAQAFTEMQVVGRIAARGYALPLEALTELERLLGGQGTADNVRLGLAADDHASHQMRDVAIAHLRRWRAFAADPLLDRTTHRACKAAERSCEEIIERWILRTALPSNAS
ncbi:dynamin family protein [Microbacterium sp. YY-03]|uniref:dynamin family protein n=1 Tax=Microbacterium sp. YY-03 TaxID=3421636 RepID=UPI003D1762E8